MTELITHEHLHEIARHHYGQAGPVIRLIEAALEDLKATYEADRRQLWAQIEDLETGGQVGMAGGDD